MMAKSWMEVLPPASALCFPCTSCFLVEGRNWGGLSNGNWTREENKLFEKALAEFDKDTPDRWEKVAVYIPGKSTTDVERHYRDLLKDVSEIEAGRFHCPSYDSSSFALDWDSNCDFKAVKQLYSISRRKSGVHISGKKSGLHAAVQERKKGVPWTEEEHKLFLLGLKMYGKGDWRNISHNFVVTRTPTQVASHAQKYFIRLHSGASLYAIYLALPEINQYSEVLQGQFRYKLSLLEGERDGQCARVTKCLASHSSISSLSSFERPCVTLEDNHRKFKMIVSSSEVAEILPLLLLLKQALMPWLQLRATVSVRNLWPHNLGSKCRRIKAATAANGHTQEHLCKVGDITLHLHLATYWKPFCKWYEGFSFD
ncbi:hypothetical protein ZIOFF_061984 [Zingiber officinale]|uniref:Transcription factor MYBS1 n=1 Tax=Zingiber officinale TaxID=94328 RepID=A0A8J5KAC0_ZINOF|nr:hypothetical protein ZIOFF_061984 [Zingiber officinale]